MKLLAGFLAVALAQDSDRWGYYDYYGNSQVGKSQSSQTGVEGGSTGPNEVGTFNLRGTLGNGRICWHCNEQSYAGCLAGSPTRGDEKRHGAGYCTGEDYFCFIAERRTIRHETNDYNFEKAQPWSAGGSGPAYQEDTTNNNANTMIRVEMGCQQPMACLRQMHMNYKIEMGLPFHVASNSLPLATLPVVHGGLAREGSCRLGQDWIDYASGSHGAANSNWRMGNWQSINSDRRYGAVRNHFHFGKGTESYCHHCCDPLIEFSAADGSPSTPYDYNGCNYNAASAATAIVSSGSSVGANVGTNMFLNRAHVWDTPVWTDSRQYHGMFRNPHTQKARKVAGNNVSSGASLLHPNA